MMLVRMCRALNIEMDHVLECTDFEKKHPRDWKHVNEVTGTPAVKLEAGTVARCWRRRAFWASFVFLRMQYRKVDPSTVLKGRCRSLVARWRKKLPTITTHSGSWNMGRVVQQEGGRQGPLLLQEVKNAMGYGTVPLESAMVGQRVVTEKEVWKALGNSIHASVMCHVMVSWLVTRC